MAVESPELKALRRGFVARTCNEQPDPQRSPSLCAQAAKGLAQKFNPTYKTDLSAKKGNWPNISIALLFTRDTLFTLAP